MNDSLTGSSLLLYFAEGTNHYLAAAAYNVLADGEIFNSFIDTFANLLLGILL